VLAFVPILNLAEYNNEDIVTGYVIETCNKALDSHTFTHFKHPLQLLPLIMRACLCNGRFTLPITSFGQISRHFQHALHFLVLS
jgi:hypothetical protein